MVKTRRNVGSLIPPVDDPEHLGANINRAIAESQSLASSGAPQAPTLSATGQESHSNTNNLPSTIMAPPVDYATTERALSNLFTHPDSEAPITAAVTENSEPLMTRLHVMDRVENDGKIGEEVEPRAVDDQDDQTAAKPEDQMRREIEGGLDPSLNLIHSSEEMLVAEVQRLRQALSSTGYEMGETQRKGAGSEPVVQKGTPPGVLLPKILQVPGPIQGASASTSRVPAIAGSATLGSPFAGSSKWQANVSSPLADRTGSGTFLGAAHPKDSESDHGDSGHGQEEMDVFSSQYFPGGSVVNEDSGHHIQRDVDMDEAQRQRDLHEQKKAYLFDSAYITMPDKFWVSPAGAILKEIEQRAQFFNVPLKTKQANSAGLAEASQADYGADDGEESKANNGSEDEQIVDERDNEQVGLLRAMKTEVGLELQEGYIQGWSTERVSLETKLFNMSKAVVKFKACGFEPYGNVPKVVKDQIAFDRSPIFYVDQCGNVVPIATNKDGLCLYSIRPSTGEKVVQDLEHGTIAYADDLFTWVDRTIDAYVNPPSPTPAPSSEESFIEDEHQDITRDTREVFKSLITKENRSINEGLAALNEKVDRLLERDLLTGDEQEEVPVTFVMSKLDRVKFNDGTYTDPKEFVNLTSQEGGRRISGSQRRTKIASAMRDHVGSKMDSVADRTGAWSVLLTLEPFMRATGDGGVRVRPSYNIISSCNSGGTNEMGIAFKKGLTKLGKDFGLLLVDARRELSNALIAQEASERGGASGSKKRKVGWHDWESASCVAQAKVISALADDCPEWSTLSSSDNFKSKVDAMLLLTQAIEDPAIIFRAGPWFIRHAFRIEMVDFIPWWLLLVNLPEMGTDQIEDWASKATWEGSLQYIFGFVTANPEIWTDYELNRIVDACEKKAENPAFLAKIPAIRSRSLTLPGTVVRDLGTLQDMVNSNIPNLNYWRCSWLCEADPSDHESEVEGNEDQVMELDEEDEQPIPVAQSPHTPPRKAAVRKAAPPNATPTKAAPRTPRKAAPKAAPKTPSKAAPPPIRKSPRKLSPPRLTSAQKGKGKEIDKPAMPAERPKPRPKKKAKFA